MADSGPGSWREGAKVISLALVDLTERIHAAISLRLQQTQAIAALLRRARDLAEGGEVATQRARQYLWNASGAFHAAIWLQRVPSSDDQVRLDRWLAQRGGSPLPLVDEEIWQKSLRPRLRPPPPAPPPALTLAEDWDPGEDPRVRQYEDARARLIERLIAAGSAERLEGLHSFDELRLLASLLWLPRNSAPLRRLGLRIQLAWSRGWRRGPSCVGRASRWRWTTTASLPPTRRPAVARSAQVDGAGAGSKAAAEDRSRRHVRRRSCRRCRGGRLLTAPLSDDPELVTRPLPAIAASDAPCLEQEPPADAPVWDALRLGADGARPCGVGDRATASLAAEGAAGAARGRHPGIIQE